MTTLHRPLIVLAACGAATMALASGATAADPPAPTVCDGALSDVTVRDVFVPYNTSCTLTRVVVEGGLTAEIDSNVVTLDRTAVKGDVSTESHRLVLRSTAVGGSVSAREARDGVVVTGSGVRGDLSVTAVAGELAIGSPTTPSAGNAVGGSLRIDSAFVPGFVARNAVRQDLRLSASQAVVDVRRNAVRGVLDCTANVPAPTGGSNAAEAKTGQCSAF